MQRRPKLEEEKEPERLQIIFILITVSQVKI